MSHSEDVSKSYRRLHYALVDAINTMSKGLSKEDQAQVHKAADLITAEAVATLPDHADGALTILLSMFMALDGLLVGYDKLEDQRLVRQSTTGRVQ